MTKVSKDLVETIRVLSELQLIGNLKPSSDGLKIVHILRVSFGELVPLSNNLWLAFIELTEISPPHGHTIVLHCLLTSHTHAHESGGLKAKYGRLSLLLAGFDNARYLKIVTALRQLLSLVGVTDKSVAYYNATRVLCPWKRSCLLKNTWRVQCSPSKTSTC